MPWSEQSKKVHGISWVYFLALAVLMMVGGAISLLFMMIPGFSLTGGGFSPLYALYLSITEFLSIGVPALIFWRAIPVGRRITLPKRKVKWNLLLVVPLSVAMFFVANGVCEIWQGVWTYAGADFSKSTMQTPQNLPQLLLSIFAVAVVPAFSEELLFRGLMTPAFRTEQNPVVAIVLTSMLFALMHGDFSAVYGHFLLGLSMGFVVWATGSLWAGILHHALHNGIAMLLVYLQTQFSGWSLMEVNAGSDALSLILTGVVHIGLFLIPAAMCYYALWRCNRKECAAEAESYRMMPPQSLQAKPAAYWPLLLAVPIILVNYFSTAFLYLFL